MTTFRLENISMGPESFTVLSHTLERRLGERCCRLGDNADYTFTLAVDAALENDRYTVVPDGNTVAPSMPLSDVIWSIRASTVRAVSFLRQKR